MQQYYLRRLMDGLLDTERSNAVSSVQPHPAIQALQAAVDVVVSSHQESDDMTTSDSSGTSSWSTGPSPSAATGVGSAVAAAAAPAEPVAQSASVAAAAASHLEDDSHHDHGQPDSSPCVPATNAQARQSGATLLDPLASCKPGKKRKAADIHEGCRSGHPAAKHQATSQGTQPLQWQTVPEAEVLQAACHSGQHAAKDQSQDNSIMSPSTDGRAAASSSLQQHADTSGAGADCAGSQDPLHMACMQLLAGAVADRLHKTGAQGASMGEPAPHVCQQSCGTDMQTWFCCIASVNLLLSGICDKASFSPLQHWCLMSAVACRSGRSDHMHPGISASRGSSACVGHDEPPCSAHSGGNAAACAAPSRC